MKRTYSTGFKDYKFSKLCLDEINDILNFIEENNYSHKIKINNFEIENRNEIKEFADKKIEYFEINIYEIYSKIKYERNNITIFFDDSISSQGMKNFYETYLQKNENKFFKFLSSFNIVMLGYILCVTTIVVFISSQTANKIKINDNISNIMGFIGSFLIINNSINSYCYKKLIILKEKNKCNNFFIRQKDNIILSIISAIIGSALTLLIELLIKKIK